MPKSDPIIFLSHAAADKELVESFETLLSKSVGILSKDIFCSSLEGQGVPKGASFVDSIRDKAVAAKAVVALITPAYLDSAFCMAELGAAWALNTHRFPIVVPPNTFQVMDATLLGIVGVKLDNDDALGQMFEEVSEYVGVQLPATAVRSRAMREFMRGWPDSSSKLKGAQRIATEIHDDVVKARDKAIEERDSAEEALSRAEAHIKALEEAKDPADVARISKEFDDSSWEEELEAAFDEIRNLYWELGGSEIARLIIVERINRFMRPDGNAFGEQLDRAVELGVYDPEGVRWVDSHPEVDRLRDIVDSVTHLFAMNADIATTLKARGEKSDPGSIRFWETHL